MSYEVEIEYDYYLDGVLTTHKQRIGKLDDKVPEELGQISFFEYRKIAAQQGLLTVVREWFVIPDEAKDKHSYRAVHHSNVVDVRATTVKTLDL